MCLLIWAGLASWAWDSQGPTGSHSQKGLTIGLMLCCHHLEIFNNFWTKGSAFLFCTEPHKWQGRPYGKASRLSSPPTFTSEVILSSLRVLNTIFVTPISFIPAQKFPLSCSCRSHISSWVTNAHLKFLCPNKSSWFPLLCKISLLRFPYLWMTLLFIKLLKSQAQTSSFMSPISRPP